ncbi:MAG: hypothetical protein EHM33_00945 [Chloroflexi bacterium]|nr:MAG: hypothetical protein EHM33_00945 [Chloroflexota bacterium]
MAKIKRSLVLTYLDTTPAASETWSLLGDGVTTGLINMNPKTTEETYITDDNATITVDSYAPTMPIEMTCVTGDPVFEYIDGLRKSRAVLGDAETEIVNVWNYETGGPTAAPAEKQAVSIQIDSFGGDGGQATKINFTINFVGDPTAGTFNTTTPAFTPS